MSTFDTGAVAVRRLGAALLLAGTIGLAVGCGSSGSGAGGGSGDKVSIGVDAGLTGYLSASSDLPFVQGVKQAVASINAAGGAAGHKLSLTIVDDASDAATGVTAANKLIAQQHVGVLMGGSLSAQCAGVSPVAVAHQVPMTCIAPPPPTGAAYSFQVAAGLGPMIATEVAFAAKKLHAKRVAFVYSQTPYGQAGAKVIAALAPKFGIQVAFSQGVDPNSSDLAPLLAQVKSHHVDALLDNLTGPVHIVEATGAATAQLGAPLVQTTDVTSVFRKAAAAYPDLYFLALPPQAYPSIGDPALKTANASLAKAFSGGSDEIGQIAYGWDAVHVIAAAVKSSHAVTGAKLRSALEKLAYQGTLSRFTYSPADHTGEKTVPNPNAIGHFAGGKLQVVFAPTAG